MFVASRSDYVLSRGVNLIVGDFSFVEWLRRAAVVDERDVEAEDQLS